MNVNDHLSRQKYEKLFLRAQKIKKTIITLLVFSFFHVRLVIVFQILSAAFFAISQYSVRAEPYSSA